jgi:hypothetical protein
MHILYIKNENICVSNESAKLNIFVYKHSCVHF